MKRKGFTLIELLAVIIILAIIALIAVPQILGVIEKSRKGAAEVSALGYIDAVEKYMIMHDIDSSKYPYDLKNNTWNVSDSTNVAFLDLFIEKVNAESIVPALNTFINVKGTKPASGTITTNNKEVTSASLVMNGYNVECIGESCSVGRKSEAPTPTPTPTTVTPEPTPQAQKYTVHYDANGGQNAPADAIYSVGESGTLSNSEPTRSGYNFLGWSTSSSATEVTYQKGATINDLTIPGETITLYAVWYKILVALIPKLSSTTGSNGTASYGGSYLVNPLNLFDDDDNTMASNQCCVYEGYSGQWISYTFNESHKIRKIFAIVHASGKSYNYTIQYYDGSWKNLDTFDATSGDTYKTYKTYENLDINLTAIKIINNTAKSQGTDYGFVTLQVYE